MNQLYTILIFSLVLIFGCSSDSDDVVATANITIAFSHYWEDVPVSNSDFNSLNYTNDHGELLSIERLRYLISDVEFTKTDGQTILIEGYNLVDVTNQTNLSYTPIEKNEKGNR